MTQRLEQGDMHLSGEKTAGYLTRDPIVPAAWRREPVDSASGAVVEFLGIVRGINHGRMVRYLEYEAFEPMVEAVLADLERQARERWGVRRVAIHHRLGRVDVGEVSVAIVVESAHRCEAFDVCRFLIDRIKQEAPIWKREHYADGSMEYGVCEHQEPAALKGTRGALGRGTGVPVETRHERNG